MHKGTMDKLSGFRAEDEMEYLFFQACIRDLTLPLF